MARAIDGGSRMNDYIKRSDALDRFTYEHGELIPEILKHGELNEISVRDIKSVLRSLPAADVVEVVRCRECAYAPGRETTLSTAITLSAT